MSIVIIAFKTAPTPSADFKARDEALDNEIRKKTMGTALNLPYTAATMSMLVLAELYNRIGNKAAVDPNTLWQQVVTSLNDQSHLREALPVGGGFIAK